MERPFLKDSPFSPPNLDSTWHPPNLSCILPSPWLSTVHTAPQHIYCPVSSSSLKCWDCLIILCPSRGVWVTHTLRKHKHVLLILVMHKLEFLPRYLHIYILICFKNACTHNSISNCIYVYCVFCNARGKWLLITNPA